jgi:MFS family permease
MSDVLEAPARPGLFDVFRHRNYRLFFTGQAISLVGFWMQAIAQAWLVYRLTDSPFWLGMVGFAGQVPVLLVSPFAGVVADRLDRRRILFVTQGTMMACACVLAGLTLSGIIEVWHIVAIALISGAANAFDVPTRQSFTIQMVGREDLPRAIALNSIMFNGARLIGPALAGVLVAAVGEGVCMALNGASYIGVLVGLSLMRLEPQAARASLFGTAYLTLMPIFARDILHGDSDALGFLMAAVGAGALVGALSVPRVPQVWLPRVPFMASACFGASLIAFSQSTSFALSLVLLAPAGFGMMLMGISTNTLVQGSVDDAMRGRVMAYYVMAFIGMVPLSALGAGALSHEIGAPDTLALGGVLTMVAALVAYLRR